MIGLQRYCGVAHCDSFQGRTHMHEISTCDKLWGLTACRQIPCAHTLTREIRYVHSQTPKRGQDEVILQWVLNLWTLCGVLVLTRCMFAACAVPGCFLQHNGQDTPRARWKCGKLYPIASDSLLLRQQISLGKRANFSGGAMGVIPRLHLVR